MLITYEDKEFLNQNSEILDKHKCNDTDLNQIKSVINGLANMFYPVNVVVPFYDDLDHSDFLGLQWERVAIGKTLVGLDPNDTDFNTIGKTGGEKTHTLSKDEMPKHDHQVMGSCYTKKGGNAVYIFPANEISDTYSGIIGTALQAGGSKAHNNLQPYEVVAYWRRIA